MRPRLSMATGWPSYHLADVRDRRGEGGNIKCRQLVSTCATPCHMDDRKMNCLRPQGSSQEDIFTASSNWAGSSYPEISEVEYIDVCGMGQRGLRQRQSRRRLATSRARSQEKSQTRNKTILATARDLHLTNDNPARAPRVSVTQQNVIYTLSRPGLSP